VSGPGLVIAEKGADRYLVVPMRESDGVYSPESSGVQRLKAPSIHQPYQVVLVAGGVLALERGAQAGQGRLRFLKVVGEKRFEVLDGLGGLSQDSNLAAVPVDPQVNRIDCLLRESGIDGGRISLLSLDSGHGKVQARQVLATKIGQLSGLLATPGDRKDLVFHYAFETIKESSGGPTPKYRLVRQGFPARTGVQASAAQRERARKLHKDSVILFAHDHDPSRQGFIDFRSGNVAAKAIMLTTDGVDWNRRLRLRCLPDRNTWIPRFASHVQELEVLEAEEQSVVKIVRNVEDIELARKQGRVGAILGVEGVLPPTVESVDWLQDLHRQGLRQLQVFWQHPNPSMGIAEKGILTDYALKLVGECNRLGIVVSCSHLGELATFQVAQSSKHPILRCHDTPKGYAPNGEATDQMIQAIASSGGGRGVFALHFLHGYVRSPDVASLVDAVDYVRDLVGIDHVALGGDYFPEESQRFAVQHVSRLEELTLELVRRGYSDDEIRKVLGLNMLRLYKDVWGSVPSQK